MKTTKTLLTTAAVFLLAIAAIFFRIETKPIQQETTKNVSLKRTIDLREHFVSKDFFNKERKTKDQTLSVFNNFVLVQDATISKGLDRAWIDFIQIQ